MVDYTKRKSWIMVMLQHDINLSSSRKRNRSGRLILLFKIIRIWEPAGEPLRAEPTCDFPRENPETSVRLERLIEILRFFAVVGL
jgi:hypothetical protein